MYSSIRNGLRSSSSSLISLVARNHVDLKASRSFSAVPPRFGSDDRPNTGNNIFDNIPRTNISNQLRGGSPTGNDGRPNIFSNIPRTNFPNQPQGGFPSRPQWGPQIGNRSDFLNRGGGHGGRGGGADSMRYVRDTIRGDDQSNESTVDFVHIKILRNNSFVTVTDSKGNKKFGFSSGSLPNKAASKSVRFSAEAASEHVGRMCRSLGMKSVVIKVNGHTHFKKKKQAIMGWLEGYTNSRTDQVPVVSIEDTTRKPHNGCRRPKARRI